MRRLLLGIFLGLLQGPALAAADLPAARTFVERLYSAYHGDGPDYLGRSRSRVFSPRMIVLLRRDQRLTPRGDVGALDGDPICDCQDFEISNVRIDVRAGKPGQARAVVTFDNLGRATTLRLDLVAVQGQWRIDNIHSESIPDLATFLRRHPGGR
jgi:hypothetical protein